LPEPLQALFRDYHPQVVIVEGLDTASELSPKSVIAFADKCETSNYRSGCGESFFAINLARKLNVDYISGEPGEKIIKNQILKEGYSVKDLLGFYLVRQIPQFKRHQDFDLKRFPEKAERTLQNFRRQLSTDEKFEFSDFKSWYSLHMSKPTDFTQVETDDSAPNGDNNATYVQKISNRVGLIRDRNIIRTIESMLNKFDRVMVVYGGSHLLTQEKALIEAMGIPKYSKIF
jgi:hypothetical protein